MRLRVSRGVADAAPGAGLFGWRGGLIEVVERGLGLRCWRLEVSEDVALGDPAAGPGGGDLGDVDVFFAGEPADGRRERWLGGVRRRLAAVAASRAGELAAPGSCLVVSVRRLCRLAAGCGGVGRVDCCHRGADGDGFAFGDCDSQHAGAGGGDVARGLVGFELEEGLAGADERPVRPCASAREFPRRSTRRRRGR